MSQLSNSLINAIDSHLVIQDYADHYEVRQVLRRIKYILRSEDMSVERQLKDEDFTLTDAIDAVVDLNGLIGVGLISLGDQLKEYCYSKA